MPVSIKSRVGHYEILSQIGAGGMGEVYRARDTKLGREVAIKVLPEAFVRDQERMVRFEREAKFLAALNHPNIAAIYGVEDAGSTDALVMELAEGPMLADRIASGPIPLAEALPIARQIADALEYAHEHGVVHRDLKPANIKVSHDGCVKVLDFGLARAIEGEANAGDTVNSPTISQTATEAGVLLGTVAYMSPEQSKAKPVDRRADIWAFGCVLYEMLTGTKAFPADTVSEMLAAVLTREPDWSLLPAATPIRVRILLQSCLQKDPRQRLRDIGDARISLDEVRSGAPDPPLAVTPGDASARWRRVLPWAVATLLFVTSAWLAFVHFRVKPAGASESMRFQIPLPEKVNNVPWVDLSPDGRHLAFSTIAEDGHRQLWVRDLDSLTARPLPGTDNAYIASWSPDSHALAFYAGNKLKRMDLSVGTPLVICPASPPYFEGSWSPEGVILFGSREGILKVSAAGGTPSIVIKARHPVEAYLGYPSFLPDGHHFLYSAQTNSDLLTYVGSLNAGDEQRSSKALATGRLAKYLPTLSTEPGSLLFLKSDLTLVAQPFDASRMQLKGDPSTVAEGIGSFTVSPNGVLAYTGGLLTSVEQLTWFNRQGKTLGTVGEPGTIWSPAISPDGRTVAVPISDGSGRTDIWLYDLEHRTPIPTRFTFNNASNLYPVWSPDGGRIAFSTGSHGSTPTVYQKPVNGVGQEEAFKTAPPHPGAAPLDWSLDGRYLIEQVYGDTAFSIWLLPLLPVQAGGEGNPIPWANEGFNVANARLSRDGKWIAYDSDETGRSEIFVRTFANPRGKWQVSTNGGTRPVWSRDGKELYYIASDENLMAVNVKSRPDGSFDAGAAKALFNPHIQATSIGFDVTKDGRFLIPVITQRSGAPVTVIVNWHAQATK